MTTRAVPTAAVTLGVILSIGTFSPATLQQQAIPIDPDDIGGVVTGPSGPEAGVWVIAETTRPADKVRAIVVTDDRGRYRHPRPAQRHLHGLGSWLRTGRLAEGRDAPGATST